MSYEMKRPTVCTIRPARGDDAEALVALWRELAAQHVDYDAERYHYAAGAADSWRTYLLDLLKRDDTCVLVAVDSVRAVCGMVVAKRVELPPVFATRHSGSVQDIFVRKEHRGCGLGRRLVQTVMECLREMGAEEITLRVAANNHAAIAFYQKLGLRPVTQEMYMPLTHHGGAP